MEAAEAVGVEAVGVEAVETLGDGRRSGGRCGLEKAIRVMQLEGILGLMSNGIMDRNCWI